MAQRFQFQRFQFLTSGAAQVVLAMALASLSLGQLSPAASAKLSAPAQGGAEVGMPVLETHNFKQLSSYGQIWTIVQDKRGVMFFGTSSEINEYDGVSWRKILVSSGTVRSMAVDSAGRIWVGADGDIGYLAPDATGTLKLVSLLDKIPEKDRDFTDVWQTLVTPQAVFFRSFQKLFRWDGKTMQVWTAELQGRYEALSAVHGHVYTAQAGIGLEEIVGDSLRLVPGGDAYKDAIKLFLYPYDETRAIVSQRDGLLSLYDGQKVTPFPTAVDDYLKENKLYISTLLKDGSLCVTTLTGGAVILAHDGKLIRILDKGAGILDSDALSAYEDRDGGVWIGSALGATRFEISSPISLFSPTGMLDAIRFKGSIYIAQGTGRAPVQRLVSDPKTNRPSFVPYAGSTQAFALRIFKDPSGKTPDQLLAATSDGVMRVEGDKLVPVIPELHILSEQAYSVTVSRKTPNRVFVAHADGVSSIRWNGSKWLDEGRLPRPVYNAHNIDEDAEGYAWASGADGRMLRITVAESGMRDSKAEVVGVKDGLPPGAGGTGFVAGNLYAGASGNPNLYRWDSAAHRFVLDNRFQLPIKDGEVGGGDGPLLYPENPQDTQHIWSVMVASQQRRIGRFTRHADGSWQLDEDTFRPLTQFKVTPAFTDPDGVVWAAGETLVRLDPKMQAAVTQQPAPLIRQVYAEGVVVFGGAESAGLGELRLKPGTSAVRFQFAAPIYGRSADASYQFLLEGADKDWSSWDKQTLANYNGLGPGSYRFRVHERGDDGKVGPEATYSFLILPPWYRTTLAYIVYALLFLLAASAGWVLISRYERAKSKRRTVELEAQARALEATVNERTQEIRMQAEEIAAQKDSIELLSEIGREITASLDLNTILFKLYERVNQIVDASVFGVGLYRPEKKLIEYSLAIENGKRYAPYTRSTEDKNQFAVWCIEHRKSILINDVGLESQKYVEHYQHTGGALDDGSDAMPPASMIYLPLIAAERVLGVLSVQSFKKNAYSEQHLSLLENLAAYTTIALDNANAYEVINAREHEVRERAAELVTINRITQALSAQLDKDRLVQLVGDQIRDLFRAPIAYVALLDRATMMLEFPYTFGEEALPRPYGSGLTSQIIRTGQPLLINEDMEASRTRLGVQPIGRNSASYLGVPIPSGGQMIGVISVQSVDTEGRFTEADQRLLSTIASAVGVAFHNARLFEEASQARASAEQADAAKSSFLSTVSHELRTPLTSVLGFAKIIRRRLEERLFPLIPEDDRKVLQTKQQVIDNLGVVISEGERLTKLIDDVLDLAKIEAGKFTWNMSSVGVKDVIDRAVAATASLFEAKKLELVREIDEDLPSIEGDQDRLIQVVINLISNAVKFTDSGSIRCAAHRHCNELVVSVTDSGIGIAPGDQPKVFEKFKQVGDTLTDKPKGTGLGLPICKEIVEYHGGRIWVDSTPGQGSTFSFTLPVTTPSAQLELLPVRSSIDAKRSVDGKRSVDIEALVKQLRDRVVTHPSRDKSVLVVDDDPNIRSLLQQELTDAGYKVRLADDGRKALALIREEIPGLVILDVMMPEMNGFDVAAVLKNDPATMDIPIIILSIVEDKERGFRLGVDRYLTKPIDTASLFHEIDALLDQGKSRRKVMVVDEDASTIRTLSDVLVARGYQVVESNGSELVSHAVTQKPDIIILNSLLSSDEAVRALRFEKGMENVLFLIYQ